MARASAKEERIHLRLSARTKRKIERAAALNGTTVTDFVVSTIASRAEQVIGDHERITLSDRDRDMFLDAVLNPPAPPKALQKAMRHYRTLNKSSRKRKK